VPASIQKGSTGQFDVVVDGETIASKSKGFFTHFTGGGWPDPDDVVKRLRERVAG
jgi:predicted Rdx family selenoprotein